MISVFECKIIYLFRSSHHQVQKKESQIPVKKLLWESRGTQYLKGMVGVKILYYTGSRNILLFDAVYRWQKKAMVSTI